MSSGSDRLLSIYSNCSSRRQCSIKICRAPTRESCCRNVFQLDDINSLKKISGRHNFKLNYQIMYAFLQKFQIIHSFIIFNEKSIENKKGFEEDASGVEPKSLRSLFEFRTT